jgi:3-oxoacyl-[acyl-carrier protein] reductase
MKNKKVLISGGTHGIGFEIAKILAKNKYDIALFSRSKKRVKNAVKSLKKYKVKIYADQVDVLNLYEIDNFFVNMKKKFGEIDILINNVGGGGNWGSEFIEKTNYKVWSEVNAKNVGAAIKLITLSIPYMKKQKWGRIITIGSISAKKGIGRPWYVLAKKSEIVLSKTLSVKRELVRNGITFNTISPGAIMISDTGWDKRRKENPSAFKKLINKKFPMGRLGRPEEIASIFPYLCSNESRFINGADICIDGGQSNEEYED